ncbi:hypothetical protein BO70DRAFT_23586 [Aspergillus heteromorphus CBS 117.55]|uniref:NmrA-like domain-containing protein n=1 Tax=Aspergillus heteromorphus CBS 117.55 TaxID=1448321 RepID=A0A317WC67_9EURO|nr:uncharacterized protein BO70DRAFT_23586 [Aspergillus heteromorphus CBS 117.55]PWY83361.1 hypothetical protein BO70DRAFT_23586 [Aspergillus heteromorphus CBS 117.55]
MSTQRIITVFRATGNQGGLGDPPPRPRPAAVKPIQDSCRHQRPRQALSAQELARQGVELVAADLQHPVLEGSHTVFLVTDYWAQANAALKNQPGQECRRCGRRGRGGPPHLLVPRRGEERHQRSEHTRVSLRQQGGHRAVRVGLEHPSDDGAGGYLHEQFPLHVAQGRGRDGGSSRRY